MDLLWSIGKTEGLENNHEYKRQWGYKHSKEHFSTSISKQVLNLPRMFRIGLFHSIIPWSCSYHAYFRNQKKNPIVTTRRVYYCAGSRLVPTVNLPTFDSLGVGEMNPTIVGTTTLKRWRQQNCVHSVSYYTNKCRANSRCWWGELVGCPGERSKTCNPGGRLCTSYAAILNKGMMYRQTSSTKKLYTHP